MHWLLVPQVVVTLGPSCHDVDTLAALLEAGMTCARVDLTWGPLAYHKASLKALKKAMSRVRRMCAVMVRIGMGDTSNFLAPCFLAQQTPFLCCA